MTNPTEVDIEAIEAEALRIAHAEYKQALDNVEERERKVSKLELKWKTILYQTRLSNQALVSDDPNMETLNQALETIMSQLGEYSKLKKLMDAIQDNAILQSQWNKLTASIRLVGGDQPNDPFA